MKKFFLLFSLLLPAELFAQDNSVQGVWKEIVTENVQDLAAKPAKFFDPKFSGQFVGDLNFDDNYQTTNRQNEYKNTSAKGRLSSKFALNKNYSLNSLLRFEQIDNVAQTSRRSALPAGGGDRSFENEALYLQELTVNYDSKNAVILAGKFTPNFGTAWKWGRGIWTNELAKNYKEVEKLGVGGIYKMGDLQKTGQYNFGFSAFKNDRKNLDNSLISNRDSDHKSDAKAGDTRSLQSYAASLDVLFDFTEGEKLSYHFSYLNLAVNSNATAVPTTKIADQKGYAAAMNYRYPVAENFLLDALLEYTEMKNVGGDSDVGEKYSTASLVGEIYKNWNVTLATTDLVRKQLSQSGFDKNLSEISAGYKFDQTVFFDKLLIQVGYKNFRTNYKTSVETNNTVGVLVRYAKAF